MCSTQLVFGKDRLDVTRDDGDMSDCWDGDWG